MKRTASILIVLTLFSTMEISACLCGYVPETFSENIRANQIIFRATILEQIEIPNDSNRFIVYHGLTKLKVDQWYQNKMKSDTIFYANGQGASCDCSLERLKVGEQVIIKAVNADIYDQSIELYPNANNNLIQFMNSYRKKPIVGYGICDVSLLKIENEKVIGNITKNYRSRQWKRIKFIRRISENWAEKLESKLRETKSKQQSWELNKFAKMMKKKWNSL